ncbi:MAG TPA: protein-L-isoaspartate(D-aspartate) O-methyltransferase [Thermoanaerobaculia bacterium]|jgi:protein-L-isoaspartate(D-aspartate) O-methyltransferase|nr:protein-L-isoaspartate(D-aspartate) O-methyltransferase [Thermoanaerobaculia bacterium]
MATDRPRRERPARAARAPLALPALLALNTARVVLAATVLCILGALAAFLGPGTAALSFGGVAHAMAVTSQQPDDAVNAANKIDQADRPEQRRLRQQMVEQQIRSRGVTSPTVVAAMQEVPRHLFVPSSERGQAYEDHPLPIGGGQTISQPYVVALMTALLDLPPRSRVLEIGTGSGYQAAVLSRVADQVYSIEIVPELGARARETLSKLGYGNVQVRIGDGYRGWPEAAPFDGILLTAAPQAVPQPLIAQLKPGGRMVLPVGGFDQNLMVLTKKPDGSVKQEKVLPVRFVPMTGEAERQP